MRKSTIQTSFLLSMTLLTLLLFWGGNCSSGTTTPTAFDFNTSLNPLQGSYLSGVIDIVYYVSMTTTQEGGINLPPGYGDVYSLVEYSTNNGVNYSLCHNTQGNPGDYFTFTYAPSTQEAIFQWDVEQDLGIIASAENCMLRVRLFNVSDDPCSNPAVDVETSEEFIIGAVEGECGYPPVITTLSLPSATDEVPYAVQFDLSGGYGECTWALNQAIDPEIVTGLTLLPSGMLEGTPVVQGTSKGANVEIVLDVTVTDSCPEGSRTDQGLFPLLILPNDEGCEFPLEFYPEDSFVPGTEGIPYNQQVEMMSLGEGELSFEIVLGALPAGLMLDPTNGTLSGTPAVGSAGVYPITIRVTDSCATPQSDELSYDITINEPSVECDPGPQIITLSVPTGKENVQYPVFQFDAIGGHGNLTWSTESTLPAGMVLNGAFLSGTPLELGTFPLAILVEDSCDNPSPQTDTGLFELIIGPDCADPPVVTTYFVLAPASEGVPYSFQLEATGGEGALTWEWYGGDPLPPDLVLQPDGLFTGIPACGSSVGYYNFTVHVGDECDPPQIGGRALEFNVSPYVCNPLTIDPSQNMTDGAELVEYYYEVVLDSPGEGALTWSLDPSSDPLPGGLTFVDGVFSGIPAQGTSDYYYFTVNVEDSCPCNPQSDQLSDLILWIETS